MADFPDFVKNPANRIALSSQYVAHHAISVWQRRRAQGHHACGVPGGNRGFV
jgi:hypothetical protein